MNKNDIKIGEDYAISVSRNTPTHGWFRGCVENFGDSEGPGKDSVVIVRKEDGSFVTSAVGAVKMRWSSYLADEAKRHEVEKIMELGRRAAEEERFELVQRTRDAGFNLVEEVRFPEGGMRVSVSYEVWNKLLDHYDNGRH